jgi:hypothetical protein
LVFAKLKRHHRFTPVNPITASMHNDRYCVNRKTLLLLMVEYLINGRGLHPNPTDFGAPFSGVSADACQPVLANPSAQPAVTGGSLLVAV